MTKAPVIAARQRAGLSLLVDREPGRQPAVMHAQLLDCSRAEIQLRVSAPLQRGERIRVRLRDESSGLQLDVAGAVTGGAVTAGAVAAQQRDESPGEWTVACRFDHELDWETLGELFLCGILETVPR